MTQKSATHSKNDNRSLRSTLTMALIIPVAICILLGLVFMMNDTSQGLFVVGVGAVLGLINFFILKAVLKKMDEHHEE